MHFLDLLVAHGDMGISRAAEELYELLFALWLGCGLVVLGNALLILSSSNSPVSKAKHTGLWVIYTALWAALILGALDKLVLDPLGRIIVVLPVPLVIISHFVVLLLQKARARQPNVE